MTSLSSNNKTEKQDSIIPLCSPAYISDMGCIAYIRHGMYLYDLFLIELQVVTIKIIDITNMRAPMTRTDFAQLPVVVAVFRERAFERRFLKILS